MRRRLVYLLAWAVATTVTAGVSWLGIRSILSAAAPGVSPLSAADLRQAAPETLAPPQTTPPPAPAQTEAPAAAPVVPSPTPSDNWAPFPDGKGGMAYRRIFRTGGGDVTVVCAKGDVKIEGSKPKSGFSVNVTRQSADNVVVTFFGPRKASRVSARWNGGPYAEVIEVTGYGT